MKTALLKNISAITMLIVLSLIILLASSCKKDGPEPTAKEINTALLSSGAWNMQQVTVDGNDRSDLFDGLSITFSGNAFTAVNPGKVWPAAGTWDFADEGATVIARGDGLTIQIEELTESNLTVSLQWNESTFSPGRKASLKGKHRFAFRK